VQKVLQKREGHVSRLEVNQTTNDETNHDPKEVNAKIKREQRAAGRGRKALLIATFAYQVISLYKLVSGRRLEHSDVSIHFRFRNFKRAFREVSISFFQTAI